VKVSKLLASGKQFILDVDAQLRAN